MELEDYAVMRHKSWQQELAAVAMNMQPGEVSEVLGTEATNAVPRSIELLQWALWSGWHADPSPCALSCFFGPTLLHPAKPCDS